MNKNEAIQQKKLLKMLHVHQHFTHPTDTSDANKCAVLLLSYSNYILTILACVYICTAMHLHILKSNQLSVCVYNILTLYTLATGVTRRAAGPNQFVYTFRQTPTFACVYICTLVQCTYKFLLVCFSHLLATGFLAFAV